MEQKKLNRKTDFLQSFKLFEDLTLQTLQKLTYYMVETNYKFKQVVYSQDEITDGVYLIKEGEFEIIKKAQVFLKQRPLLFSKKANDHDLNKMKDFRVSIVGAHNIIGYSECINNINRQDTLKCISGRATAYFIAKKEFLERFKLTNSDKIMQKEIKNKQNLIDLRNRTLSRAKFELYEENMNIWKPVYALPKMRSSSQLKSQNLSNQPVKVKRCVRKLRNSTNCTIEQLEAKGV